MPADRTVRPRASVCCEPLEPRRLFATEVLSVAAGALVSGDAASGETLDLSGGAPAASIVSDDGRYVAFSSAATNLVPGLAPGGTGDVYLRDRTAAATTLVSARPDGQPAGQSGNPSLSGDGRYIAFTSDSLQILPGLTTGQNVFVRDLQTDVTSLVSHAAGAAGTPANGPSSGPVISRDGRFIVFVSSATDLTPGVPQPAGGGVYRYNVQTGAIDAVSDGVADIPAVTIDLPQLSDDGNTVAFLAYSAAAPPVAGDPGALMGNAYVKNMTTGVTTVATMTSAGQPLNGPASDLLAELSADGRKVVFMSSAPATPDDTNHATDVYVRDLAAGTTSLVSAAANGASAPDASAAGSAVTSFGGRSISADGRYVVFESADDLTGAGDPGASAPLGDVFLRDLSTHTTRLLSTDPPGTQYGESFYPTISADGRFAAFYTDRADPADAGAVTLVVRDLSNDQEVVVNQQPGGGAFDQGTSINRGSAFSRSGDLLLFLADDDASALVPQVADANGATDLLARTLPTGPLDALPPTITVGALPGVTTSGGPFYDFDVTYSDDTAIDAATLGAGDLVVTGPNGYRQAAALLSATPAGAQVNARYRVVAPNGVFDAAANGAYAVEVAPGEVADISGNPLAAGPVPGATFAVDVPMPDGPDLQATALTGAVPASLIAGVKQKLKPLLLTVTNSGTAPAAGTFSIRVVASADAVADANDAVVAEQPRVKLKLLPGQTKVFKVKVGSMPAVADGDYRLLAVIDAGGALPERLESNNAAALAAPVHIAAPFVDVGIANPTLTGKLAAGKKATLLLTAHDDGNQAANGALPVRVRLTTDPADPAAASREFNTMLKLNLKPGATKALRAKLALPADLPAGSYFIVVELLPAPAWTDADATDNAATSAAPYTA